MRNFWGAFQKRKKAEKRLRRGRTLRRLVVEQLEGRQLLAVLLNTCDTIDSPTIASDIAMHSTSAEGVGELAEIRAQILDSSGSVLSPTIVGGVPQYTIGPGERFSIRTQARDLRPNSQGVFSVYTDINYATVGNPTAELAQVEWSEVQTLRFSKGTNGGTFTLTYGSETTTPIIYSTDAELMRGSLTTAIGALSFVGGASNIRIRSTPAIDADGPIFDIFFVANRSRMNVQDVGIGIDNLTVEGGGVSQLLVNSKSDPANSFVFSGAVTYPVSQINSNGDRVTYDGGSPVGSLQSFGSSGYRVNDVGNFARSNLLPSFDNPGSFVNVFDTSFIVSSTKGAIDFTIGPSGNIDHTVSLFGMDTNLPDNLVSFPTPFRILVIEDLLAVDDLVAVPEDSGVTNIVVGANDIFKAGTAFTLTGLTHSSNGKVAIVGGSNVSATVSFTPTPGFTGQTTFTYTINNDQIPSKPSTATVTVTVNPINHAPTAIADSGASGFTVVKAAGVASQLDVLRNDLAGDVGDTIQVTTLTQPESGVVAIGANGTNVTYTPSDTTPVGSVQRFTYTITDGGGLTSTAYVEVSIDPPTRPFAVDDSITTPEDTSIDIDVLSNDFANSGSEKRLQSILGSISPSIAGTIVIVDNGTPAVRSDDFIRFTPAAGFSGLATFVYSMDDSSVGSVTTNATVTLNVGDFNDPPTIFNQTVTGVEDTALSILSTTILAGASPGQGESNQILTIIMATVLTQGSGSTVVTNGNIVFTPTANFNGQALINFTVIDNGTTNGIPDPKSASATLTVNVAAVNDSPVATSTSEIAGEEDSVTPVTIPASSLFSPGPSDESSQTVSIKSAVAVAGQTGGAISVDNGNLIFTPAKNFNGTFSFIVIGQDDGVPIAESFPSTVTISVTPVNDVPVPVTVSRVAFAAVPLTIDLTAELAQASRGGGPDEIGQAILVNRILPLSETRGTASLDFDGTIRYIAPANFSGTDIFEYEVIDNGLTNGIPDGKFGIARITIDVSLGPATAPDSFDVPQNWQIRATDATGAMTVTKADDGILANDPGNISRVELVAQPTRGLLTLNLDGTFLYRPNSDSIAGQVDTFSYRAFDIAGNSSPDTTVTLRISDAIASPHRNAIFRYDVNASGSIEPIDVLIIINNIIRYGFVDVRELLFTPSTYLQYIDVNGDFFLSPIDVLQVINDLVRFGVRALPVAAEGENANTDSPIRNEPNYVDLGSLDDFIRRTKTTR